MPGQRDQAVEVLEFWFAQSRPRQWFAKDAAFDGLVRDRFHGLTEQAFAGDPQALALSMEAVEHGWVEAEPEQARRQFWLMPLFERFSDLHRNAALGRVSSAEELAFLQHRVPASERLSVHRGEQEAATGAHSPARPSGNCLSAELHPRWCCCWPVAA